MLWEGWNEKKKKKEEIKCEKKDVFLGLGSYCKTHTLFFFCKT